MKLPRWITVLLIAALLMNIKAAFDISSMRNEIIELKSKINLLDRNILDIMSDTTSKIRRTLEKEASIVNEFKYENLGFKDKKIDYIFSVIPKVYNEGDKLYFLIKTDKGSSQLIPAETEDNIIFTASTSISILDEANIDLVIESEDNKKTEKLDIIPCIASKYASRINIRTLENSLRPNVGGTKRTLNLEYELIKESYAGGDSTSIEEANLHIELNGKVIDTFPMKLEGTKLYGRFHVLVKDYELQCNTGDKIVVYITAKDNMGLNYKCYMDEWIVEEDGRLDHSPGKYRYRDIEVY